MPSIGTNSALERGKLGKKDRERLKQASRQLLAELTRLIAPLEQWTQKE
jgi:type I restriction enzyme, R subunit